MTRIKVSEGIEEDGIYVGNTFDKYGSRNPIVRWMMDGFESALNDLFDRCTGDTIHEVGCGEGKWSLSLSQRGHSVRASDFSKKVIEIARGNAEQLGVDANIFQQKSIYDLNPETDCADIVVCCEVLEHLEDPARGLKHLRSITQNNMICSVPREPIWRALNMARGKYWSDLGNTPGHFQHWSKGEFQRFISTEFNIVECRSPLPWTMLLCTPK